MRAAESVAAHLAQEDGRLVHPGRLIRPGRLVQPAAWLGLKVKHHGRAMVGAAQCSTGSASVVAWPVPLNSRQCGSAASPRVWCQMPSVLCQCLPSLCMVRVRAYVGCPASAKVLSKVFSKVFSEVRYPPVHERVGQGQAASAQRIGLCSMAARSKQCGKAGIACLG